MAIIRIWQTSWELNNVLSEIHSRSSTSASVQASNPKTGTYSLRLGSASVSWSTVYVNLMLSPTLNQFRVSSHLMYPTSFVSKGLIYLLDESSNILFYVKVNNEGTGVGLFNSLDVQIGNYYTTVSDQYYHYGIDIKKNSVGGWIYFYVDGNLVASFDGNTSDTYVSIVTIGPRVSAANTPAGNFLYCDDSYVDNTSGESSPAPIPDERFYYKGLNGDGTYLEFSTYTGSTHYTLLDEIPPSGNDYVYSLSPGQRDSYQFSNFTLTSGETIEALIPLTVARKESAANILLGLGTGLSGTFFIGSFQSLPTSYGINIFQRIATNPFGADWSENDINNAQLFIMSSGTYI